MIEEKKDVEKLWNDYKKNGSLKTRHSIIMNYIWLVKYVLNNMNIPTNSILDESDFLNIGILGLHDAIERFELDRGVKFESYALSRIKGTIQDELRRLDWLSRSARKKAHDFLVAGDTLRSEVGREVSSEEIRKKLNVSHDEYNSYLAAAAAAKAYLTLSESTQILIDDEKDVFDDVPDPANDAMIENIETEERIAFINDNLKSLNERKRLIISLYYFENLTFKEIGNILDVSESRVCQIHSQVLIDLRIKLKEFDNA
jgi:RNA polymerase sigma factor FliA